jgi:hypothetical protein
MPACLGPLFVSEDDAYEEGGMIGGTHKKMRTILGEKSEEQTTPKQFSLHSKWAVESEEGEEGKKQ